MTWLRSQLASQVDGSSLGLFRIVWGLLMVWEAIRKLPKVTGIYSPEYFHFKYSLFPFVEPLPQIWMMRVEVWAMLIAAVMIAAGVWFRRASCVFLFIYTHLFLIDKLYYNNHFYLTILIGILLAASNADVCYRFRAPWSRRRRSCEPKTIPLWNLVLLRGQVVILYFFGGIAKLNSDWLQGEPVRYWFSMKPSDHILSPVLGEEWFVWFVCWTGLLLDFSAGFLLLTRRTRVPAMLAICVFHGTNSLLFQIGLFPLIGIGMLILFVDPDRPRKLHAWFRKRIGKDHETKQTAATRAVSQPRPASWGLTAFVLCYLAFQVFWPIRTLAYRENPSWSEVGHCFSWRMMLRHKDAFMQLMFDPPEAERYLEQHPEALPKISRAHLVRMVKSPHFILQYTHALSKSLERRGISEVRIRCISIASLNGRPYQLMIDPRVDLAAASYGLFEVPDWIFPLERHRRAGRYPTTVEEREKAIADAARVIKIRRRSPQVRQVSGQNPARSRQ